EVIIGASRCKSMLINRACVGKDAQVAVCIVRRTKLFVGCAGIAAGDTVATASPGPSHRVACEDGDCVWRKRETWPDLHIDNLAGTGWHAVHCRSTVLIHYVDLVGNGP